MINKQEMVQSAQERIRWDDRLKDCRITVNAEDGKIRLTGTVPTYSKREIAREDVMSIPGVREIENNLVVQFPEKMPMASDENTRSMIEQTLGWESGIHINGMKVTVDHGTVTLKGFVESNWQKIEAGNIVNGIRGVIEVRNELVVSGREIDDERIAQEIVRILEDMPHCNLDAIEIKVEHGCISLYGRVTSRETLQQIGEAVEQIDGVRETRNHLRLAPA